MKWIKFEDEMSSEMEEMESIKSIPKPKPGGNTDIKKLLEKHFNEKFNEWIMYPVPDNKEEYTTAQKEAVALYADATGEFPKLTEGRSTRKYEIFCGGFLYYHDVVFKKYPKGKGFSLDKQGNPIWKVYKKAKENKFEHKIYFEWLPKGKTKKKNSVRIYINETPVKFNVDPPPPPKPPPPEA